MRNHVMLDIETFGKNSHAAIVSLGAVKFDPHDEAVDPSVENTFYYRVSLESSLRAGLLVDASTIDWWMHADRDSARRVLYSETAHSIAVVLDEFYKWMSDRSDYRVWGNSAAFDNVIVSNAYEAIGRERPWNFRNDRCFRTLKALAGNIRKPETFGIGHHALHDAISQAIYVQAVAKQTEMVFS